MTARNMELRAILDWAFATASFDYRLTAASFAFDNTGFEGARAAGKGRLSQAPTTVPVAFRAARVTGVGDVAGRLLLHPSPAGELTVTRAFLTGNDLKLEQDKINGRTALPLALARAS